MQWVKDQVTGPGRRGMQARMSRATGIPPDVLTKILKGRRELLVKELNAIVDFLGKSPPIGKTRPTDHRKVRIMGTLGDDYWASTSKPAEVRTVNSPVNKYPIEAQTAFEVGADSVDGVLRRGDVVFTVPHQEYRPKPISGDVLVYFRENDGRVNYTLVIVTGDDGAALAPYLVDEPAPEGGHPIALVVSHHRDWG